jgi:hypothetical protein
MTGKRKKERERKSLKTRKTGNVCRLFSYKIWEQIGDCEGRGTTSWVFSRYFLDERGHPERGIRKVKVQKSGKP